MVPTTSSPSSPRYSRVVPSWSSMRRTTAAGRLRRINSVGSEREPTMGRPPAVMRYTWPDCSPPPAKRRSQRAQEPPSRLIDRDGEHHGALSERVVPQRIAHYRVLLADRLRPALRQTDRRRLRGGARHFLAIGVYDQQLLVVGESLAHGAEIAGEPVMRPLAAGALDAVEVLRDFVRARDHPQLVQALLDPQVDLARRLRTHAL